LARASGLLIPLLVVTAYYALLGTIAWGISGVAGPLSDLMPVGAIDMRFATDDFVEVLQSGGASPVSRNMASLAIAMAATVALMVPVSWVYMLTHGRKQIEVGFIQTIISLPIAVCGVAMIVQNNFALAFALTGIVAVVRFRLALVTTAQALYVFAAIVVGLGAGISALEVSAVMSTFFVYAMIVLWKLDYGEYLDGPVISIFTGRRTNDE